jgi:AcrR family transcriptional regulator
MRSNPSPIPVAPIPSSASSSALGRKPVISREDIIEAALKLVGPHRHLASLSLREVAREAGIAPNSFYRQFRDIDELAVALIERAGESLRSIIGEARQRATSEQSVVRGSILAFMEQLHANDRLLHILLREGMVGSEAFKQAVEKQLGFFEEELQADLMRLAEANKTGLFEPLITARAITRLVFAMGAQMMDLPPERHAEFTEQVILMVRMIVTGTQTLAASGLSPR